MIDLDMYDAKKILDPTWLPVYEKNIKALSHQMLLLNANLFVLEKIADFDFDLFGGINTTFWAVVSQSLFESSVMCAWRIAVDSDSDCLTIDRFKNAVLRHILLPDVRKLLKEELKKISLGAKTSDIKSRIKHIRHTLLAHCAQFLEVPTKPAKPFIPAVTLQDLRAIRDEVNEYISVLGLGTEHGKLPIDYDPSVTCPMGMDARPDIVAILDDIAKKSPVVNMPEKEPDFWKTFRSGLTKQQMNQINHYRIMLGIALI